MENTPLQSTLQTEVSNWFNSLEPVNPKDMIGLWKGSGHPSGHPLEGVLENLHWFGKRSHPDMRADALLFEGDPGKLIAIEPAFFGYPDLNVGSLKLLPTHNRLLAPSATRSQAR